MSRQFRFPSDWKTSLLDAITTRGSGHTPSQKFPEYWDGGVKWVSLADSSALDNRYIFETDKKISMLGIRKSSAVLHPPNTVILSRDAGVGKSAILGQEMAVSQHFIAWNCGTSRRTLHPEFLYYWLQWLKPEFERMAVGSTVKTIGLPYFKKLKITYPAIQEQTAIAVLLSTCDAAIEKTERLIAAKESRFTVFTLELLDDGTRDWQQLHLHDLCEPITRKNDVGEVNVLTTSAQHGLVSQLDYYKKSVSAEDVSGYYLLKPGEFAYNRSSSNGYPYGAIKRLESDKQGVLSTLYLCFAIKSGAQCNSDFLAHAFEAGVLNRQLAGVCQEGARSHGLLNITKTDFFGLKISLPPLAEQRQIAAILNAARQEIDLLKRQAEAYRRQKRGLMQKLLTGVWRVKVGEEGQA